MGALSSRPLALLLSVIVLLTSVFVLSASALSDNLIDSDLSNWENVDGYDTVSVFPNSNIYRVSGQGSSSSGYLAGMLYDMPSFTAGHSYTLKFKLSSSAEISSAWGVSWTDSNTISYYNNANLFVGYGFLSADGSDIENQVLLYHFNSSNISDYLGKTLQTSFVSGSSSGQPVVFIGITSTDTKIHHFYFSDFVMFDMDDNSKELTGIKGFLHSIRWDLTGGSCDDLECIHSSEENPHIGLFDKLALKIEGFFNTFSDTISGFFTGLGNLILYFDWEGDYENPFENENGTVESLSNELKKVSDYVAGVGDSFEGIVDSLTGALELFSKFTERFDWLITICVFTLAVIVISRFIGL